MTAGFTGRKHKATCAVCLAEHSLRGDGRVHPHSYAGQPCDGGHQFPAAAPAPAMSAEAYMRQFAPGGELADV